MLSPTRAAALGRRSLLTAGAGAAAATLIGCGSDQPTRRPNGVDEVTYVTGFNVTGQDAFVFATIEQGWYREAGITVKVVPGAGTRANLLNLREGNAQFAVIDITGGLLEINAGTFNDFMLFAAIYQNTVSCIVALPGSGIQSPLDLAGKRIGFSEGGVNRTVFPAYARLAGLDYSTVKWVSLQPPSIRPALIAGQLDAATEIVVGRPAIEAAAGKQVTMLPYSDHMRDLYGNALGTTAKLARENPDLVRRFRDATLRGLRWTIDNPDAAGEIMAKHNPVYKAAVAAAEVRETVSYVRGNATVIGALDKNRLNRSIALVQGIGLVKSGITPDQFTAFDLVPTA